jgi:hypothetical protein
MELALVLRELWGRKRLLVVGLIVSAIAGWCSVYHVNSLLPPTFTARSLEYSAASTTVFVDWPASFVGDTFQNIEPLIQRTQIYANLMASRGMVAQIGAYAHIPGDQIWASGPVDPNVQQAQAEPTAEKRNVQITGESMPYKLNFYSDPTLPLISFYTQAPSNAQALALANAAVRVLSNYVAQLGQRIPSAARVIVRRVGEPTAGPVDAGIRKKLAAAVFVAAFVAWCALVLIAMRMGAYWRVAGVVARRKASPKPSRDVSPPSDLEDWTPQPDAESLLEPEPANS